MTTTTAATAVQNVLDTSPKHTMCSTPPAEANTIITINSTATIAEADNKRPTLWSLDPNALMPLHPISSPGSQSPTNSNRMLSPTAAQEMPQWKRDLIRRRKENVARSLNAVLSNGSPGGAGLLRTPSESTSITTVSSASSPSRSPSASPSPSLSLSPSPVLEKCSTDYNQQKSITSSSSSSSSLLLSSNLNCLHQQEQANELEKLSGMRIITQQLTRENNLTFGGQKPITAAAAAAALQQKEQQQQQQHLITTAATRYEDGNETNAHEQRIPDYNISKIDHLPAAAAGGGNGSGERVTAIGAEQQQHLQSIQLIKQQISVQRNDQRVPIEHRYKQEKEKKEQDIIQNKPITAAAVAAAPIQIDLQKKSAEHEMDNDNLTTSTATININKSTSNTNTTTITTTTSSTTTSTTTTTTKTSLTGFLQRTAERSEQLTRESKELKQTTLSAATKCLTANQSVNKCENRRLVLSAKISDKLQENQFIKNQEKLLLANPAAGNLNTNCENSTIVFSVPAKGKIAKVSGKINSCSSLQMAATTIAPKDNTLTNLNNINLDDLRYGPGIVSKLRYRYLSLAFKENETKHKYHYNGNLRRSTSLNNLLDEDEDDDDVDDEDDHHHHHHTVVDNNQDIEDGYQQQQQETDYSGSHHHEVNESKAAVVELGKTTNVCSTRPVNNFKKVLPISCGILKSTAVLNNLNFSTTNGNDNINNTNSSTTTTNTDSANTVVDGTKAIYTKATNLSRTRHLQRCNDSLKRARSVEALLWEKSPWQQQSQHQQLEQQQQAYMQTDYQNRSNTYVTIEDKIHNARERLQQGTDYLPPKRLTSIIDDSERPPPDLVKQTLRMFEATANRRLRSTYRANGRNEVANKVETFRNMIKENKPAVTFPKPHGFHSTNKKANVNTLPPATKPAKTLPTTTDYRRAIAFTNDFNSKQTEGDKINNSDTIVASNNNNLSEQTPDIIPRQRLIAGEKQYQKFNTIVVNSPVSALTKDFAKLNMNGNCKCSLNKTSTDTRCSWHGADGFHKSNSLDATNKFAEDFCHGNSSDGDSSTTSTSTSILASATTDTVTNTDTATAASVTTNNKLKTASKLRKIGGASTEAAVACQSVENTAVSEADVAFVVGDCNLSYREILNTRVSNTNITTTNNHNNSAIINFSLVAAKDNSNQQVNCSNIREISDRQDCEWSDGDGGEYCSDQSKRITKAALDNIAKAGTTHYFQFTNATSPASSAKLTNNRTDNQIEKTTTTATTSATATTTTTVETTHTINSGDNLAIADANIVGLTINEIEKNRKNELKRNSAGNHNTTATTTTTTSQQKLLTTAVMTSSPSATVDATASESTTSSPYNTFKHGPLWAMRKRRQSPPAAQTENTTMVFNFSSRKEVPDYIESDGVIFRRRRELPKPNDSGFVLLDDLAVDTETSTDVADYDDFSLCPPSPCDVEFVNANVVIDGKSSIRQKPKDATFRVQFNDTLTSTFEYPSEASLIVDDSFSNGDAYVQAHRIASLAAEENFDSYNTSVDENESITKAGNIFESDQQQQQQQQKHHHVAVDEIIELPRIVSASDPAITTPTTTTATVSTSSGISNVSSSSTNPIAKSILGNLPLGSAPLGFYTPIKAPIDKLFQLGLTPAPKLKTNSNSIPISSKNHRAPQHPHSKTHLKNTDAEGSIINGSNACNDDYGLISVQHLTNGQNPNGIDGIEMEEHNDSLPYIKPAADDLNIAYSEGTRKNDLLY